MTPRGTGAVPETGWLEGSQLRLDDGVVCDATGRAADDVYAVGDVARWDGVHLIAWGPKARTVALYGRDGRLTGAVGFSAAAAAMRLRADIVAGTAVSDVLARLAP